MGILLPLRARFKWRSFEPCHPEVLRGVRLVGLRPDPSEYLGVTRAYYTFSPASQPVLKAD
jgi:hypothetical protein